MTFYSGRRGFIVNFLWRADWLLFVVNGLVRSRTNRNTCAQLRTLLSQIIVPLCATIMVHFIC